MLFLGPYALSKHGIVSADSSMLFMAGGTTPDSNPNELFWQYNAVLNEWKDISNMQNPRSELGTFLNVYFNKYSSICGCSINKAFLCSYYFQDWL